MSFLVKRFPSSCLATHTLRPLDKKAEYQDEMKHNNVIAH